MKHGALLFWGGVAAASSGLIIGQVIPQQYPDYDYSVQSDSALQPAALFIVTYSTYFIILGFIAVLLALFL